MRDALTPLINKCAFQDWQCVANAVDRLARKARKPLSDGYARQRAGYGRRNIQVLDDNWNLAETITNEDLKHVV